MIWRCGQIALDVAQTRVMGVVNVTPDSFSDGGLYARPEEAVRRVRNCVAEGAGVVDVGGESTRPGAEPIGWEEEWRRIAPVFAALAEKPLVGAEGPVALSVDTYHLETAARAVAAGASVVNCVYDEPLAEMVRLARETGVGLIAPCRGAEDLARLKGLDGFDALLAEGRFLADPEIGFGTTREEDLALLGALPRLARLVPVCVGLSRKRLVQKLAGAKVRGAGKDVGGSVGAAVWCAMAGAAVVRVHDVRETVQAIRIANALAHAVQDEGRATA